MALIDTANSDKIKTYGSIDTIDLIAVLLVVFGTAVVSAFATMTVAGYDVAAVAIASNGIEITWALGLPILGYILGFVTNRDFDQGLDDLSQVEMGAVILGVGSLLIFIVSPPIAAYVQGSLVVGGFYTFLHLIAITAVAAN